MHPTSSFALKNSGKILAEPMLETLPDLFVSYFVKIIKVGNNVPRMEYYMTAGRENLHIFFYSKFYTLHVFISKINFSSFHTFIL